MPTYEYRCEKCQKKFEITCSIVEHGKKKPCCPKCDSRKVVQEFSSFFAKTESKS